ncbi:hypothetical protein LNO89_27800 [Klebsiella pneumoniae subsp. pneumoniae]|nr:hypothetical protein [Klebsiella pneumoniae subsp. pneumoniae]
MSPPPGTKATPLFLSGGAATAPAWMARGGVILRRPGKRKRRRAMDLFKHRQPVAPWTVFSLPC